MGTMTDDAAAEPTFEQARGRLREILEGQWAVMLFTHGRDGSFQGRPMARARIEDDGTMYFATKIDSKKVAEVSSDSDVTVAVQGKAEYAVVRGTARVTQSRALAEELWDDSWRAWFAEGKSDPSIAIVVVTPVEGTYWDASRSQGLSFLYRLAKSRLTGEQVEPTRAESAHVDMKNRTTRTSR